VSRTLQIEVTLTVADDAEVEAVADAVLDYLCAAEDEDLPGVETVDCTDWDRSL